MPITLKEATKDKVRFNLSRILNICPQFYLGKTISAYQYLYQELNSKKRTEQIKNVKNALLNNKIDDIKANKLLDDIDEVYGDNAISVIRDPNLPPGGSHYNRNAQGITIFYSSQTNNGLNKIESSLAMRLLLAHELGHLCLHDKGFFSDSGNAPYTHEEEIEACYFAKILVLTKANEYDQWCENRSGESYSYTKGQIDNALKAIWPKHVT